MVAVLEEKERRACSINNKLYNKLKNINKLFMDAYQG